VHALGVVRINGAVMNHDQEFQRFGALCEVLHGCVKHITQPGAFAPSMPFELPR
jgi:hypothetical protein